ncbi:2-hydroxyacid dehydrogenase [Jeongeupia naejangsanensis]|uniref:2-hydroxyacid dehydrogenase n=1 Tax=Jeongeupia naejangsanensis TaxID=613195 RepID=A0ABS2BKM3_9NEIS|nr:2-hydroxyacid dehydrogenase [Jeongeupia naejangsanensis]MBM3116000.1 2-hydroxyacid dehydrogenase [Jeongeupia naejangsanensis]
MRIAVFDSKRYDEASLNAANARYGHELVYFGDRLNRNTVPLAAGFDAVCPFVNDTLDASTLNALALLGVKHVALRCAGFNGVDLVAAKQLGITVTRVPAYSPEAVAEHLFALLLTLVRKTHRAYTRVRDGNFSLEGLEGFNLHGRTFGVIGAGKIGQAAMRIANGFGMRVLAFDRSPDTKHAGELGCTFVPLDQLLREADVISLHVPLFPETRHLINAESLSTMKRGAVIINTSRGGLIDSAALVDSLKSGQTGGVGLDVYEYEEGVFFEDLSGTALQDDTLARLMTFPNVVITSHQGYLTHEALTNIADTVFENLDAFAKGLPLANAVHA